MEKKPAPKSLSKSRRGIFSFRVFAVQREISQKQIAAPVVRKKTISMPVMPESIAAFPIGAISPQIVAAERRQRCAWRILLFCIKRSLKIFIPKFTKDCVPQGKELSVQEKTYPSADSPCIHTPPLSCPRPGRPSGSFRTKASLLQGTFSSEVALLAKVNPSSQGEAL